MKLTTINGKTIYGSRFYSLELAESCVSRMIKPGRIILGDFSEYWVVLPVDAERLVRAGYEYAI
ncbi:MAG: hypothetical protein BWY82_03003 [Verrucomicrobia bacterium ADurb.Bin474]|nr:MAG: hypothetical protein BWY82_03003 [Verrucomicrobia bacterium ADurb.Bin474]